MTPILIPSQRLTVNAMQLARSQSPCNRSSKIVYKALHPLNAGARETSSAVCTARFGCRIAEDQARLCSSTPRSTLLTVTRPLPIYRQGPRSMRSTTEVTLRRPRGWRPWGTPSTQSPQAMQFSSFTASTTPPTSRDSRRQASTQMPQLMHSLSATQPDVPW